MKRHLVSVLTFLSLLPCVAVAALWVRSYFVGDGFVWKPSAQPPYYSMYVGQGGVRMDSGRYAFDHDPYLDYQRDPTPARQIGFHPRSVAAWLGFDWHRGTDTKNMPHGQVLFPLWFVFVPAAFFPVALLASSVRRRRRAMRLERGQCTHCGYDLRATPNQCPECGTRAPPRSAAA